VKSARFRFLVAIATLASGGLAQAAPLSEIEVTQILNVDTQQISRTVYEISYRVSVASSYDHTVTGLTGTITSVSTGVEVLDRTVHFDDIAAVGSQQSRDAILIRLNRRTPFSMDMLQWSFDGELVQNGLPPDPGSAGRETLGGIDSDKDGVRDDLQRKILEQNLDEEKTKALIQYAIALQEAMRIGAADPANELQPVAKSIVDSVDCLYARFDDDAREQVKAVERLAINTDERYHAYNIFNDRLSGQFFGGNRENQDGCQP
jgi:hypothetical protein